MSSVPDDSERASDVRHRRRSVDDIRSWLIAELADRVGVAQQEIDTREAFASYGIPSKEAVALSGELEEWLGRPVSPTVAWEYPTIEMLAAHLGNEATEHQPTSGRERETHGEALALIGIGCRFPSASSPAAFWRLLTEGRDAITEVPADRWDLSGFYDPNPATPGTINTRWGSFIDRIDRFDAAFFGITPREASRMDPQQRLLLEVAWEALEDAGQPIESLAGTKTGVFVGISTNDYGRRQFSHPALIDAYAGTGNALSIAANRISYQFDFVGPSIAVDTACSSSLVAVHLACRSIWNGEATLALAGGVNLILRPDITINFTKAGVMAPDGRCKTFDARADGYVRGEGAGLVVLKPLSRALADGDPIYAVILGSAINNDGRTNGLMAPSRLAQETVLRDAYKCARVSPGLVQYVEAHGTGTLLGDPIEAKALGTVLTMNRAAGSRSAVGSVKTNIGHLEAAAGIAGLVKVALALKQCAIPPSLHFETPNPHIPFADLPLRVQQTLADWPSDGGQRIAGISSFGFGGTNAHVVLRDQPAPQARNDECERQSEDAYVLPLSARSSEALQSAKRAFCDFLKSGDGAKASLRDICYTAAVRRSHHEYRLAVTGRARGELIERLEALPDKPSAALSRRRATSLRRRQTAFVFPGQGSQWAGMGRQLLQQEPIFHAALADCDRALRQHVAWSLVEQLTAPDASSRLNEIDVAQPALFAVQVSLAALWRSWGIEPAVVVGQSVGEVAAAHVAGALTLQDAARIVCERSRLLKTVSGCGAMAVVDLSLDAALRAAEPFEGRVSVAVENSPASTILSGDAVALEALIAALERQDVFCRLVKVDVASHSPQVDPLLDELRGRLAAVRPRIATIPLYSTVTGDASNGVGLDGEYWARNLRERVLFSTAVQRLLAGGCETFLEISPHPVLLGAMQQTIQASAHQAAVLPSLRRGEDERAVMLGSLGTLYTLGHAVKWNQLFPGGGQCIALHSYPWQRERCWFELGDAHSPSSPDVGPVSRDGRSRHPLLERYLECAGDSKTHLWEVEVSLHSHPYVTDHRIGQDAVLPGTAYLEMALAAAIDRFGTGCVLTDVEFTQALFFHDAKAARTLQLAVSEMGSREASFRIYSRPRDESPRHAWVLHARGKVRRDENASGGPTLRALDWRAIQVACDEEMTGEHYYTNLQASGLHYGPSFQGIERVWKGQDDAVGLISAPAAIAADVDSYCVHPALFDAALQVAGAVLATGCDHNGDGEPYLPVRIGELRVAERPGTRLWSVVSNRMNEDAPHRVTTDVRLVDETGQVLVDVRGLELHRLDRDVRTRTRNVGDWLYERRWEPKALAGSQGRSHAAATSGNGQWIVFADREDVASRLTSLIERDGGSCVVVRPGVTYVAAGRAYEIDPGEPAHARQLLGDVLGHGSAACRGIVHLWNLEAGDSAHLDLAGLESAQLSGCASVLHLIQAAADARATPAPRLFLVTRRAQCVTGRGQSISVAQSPVWGLARTIAHEHPEFRCTNVDLGEANAAELESLYEEHRADDDEDQIAVRDRLRYVARLDRVSGEEIAPYPAHPFRLEVSSPGVIDRLAVRKLPRTKPGAGQVEIEVKAAGVNFMDVMRALALVPSPAGGRIWPGAECVGQLVVFGEGVDVQGARRGDDVIAIAPGSFASFATTSSALVARKPDHLSIEEAATIPVAFLTAYYALSHAARVRTGERVLIHAAAGGVGLAAIQIARGKGAEIFATAGSPEKRRYLHSLGIEHVFDSRSLAFGEEVMARTRGEGIDVVLNSLSGVFADASLSLLRRGGRFLEIGKRDIHENRPLHLRPFEKNLAFFAIDLQQMCAERPAFVGAMLRRLVRRFEDRTLSPLPVQVFAMPDAGAALRFMAQAKHTGKIVLSMPEHPSAVLSAGTPSPICADATYLITGGLGGIGLTVAQWTIEHGARHLVLVGRSRASAAAEAALTRMRQSGAIVNVFETDVADREQVASLLNTICATMPPLRGVIHAAGVLDDGVLAQLDRARLASVARPKIVGAWNLHTLTLDRALDFFIMFSSAASMFGSPGQGNYAAANAFLDALAHHRRVNGLPALSINWGTWSKVGLAARRGRADRLATRGIDPISPEDGVDVFGRLLKGGNRRAQILVVPIDWDRLDARAATLPMLAPFAGRRSSTGTTDLERHVGAATRDAILRATEGDRRPLLQSFIREQLAGVLGLSPSNIDVQRPLNTLGVDSLMAIELRNRIERELGVSVRIAILLQAPDVVELADHLAQQLSGNDAGTIAEIPRAEALPAITPDPASRYAPFPLNDIQGAYWVGRSASLELGNVGSHFYLEFESSDLDIDRLSGAWQQLIARHDMLRAVVKADGRQQVLAGVPAYSIEVTDAQCASPDVAQAEVAAVRERMAHQVYDPVRWPLFEIRATRLPNRRVRVHVSIDLLIADVWSLFILFREWGTLYMTPARTLAPLTLSFRDYVLAEASLQATPQFARAQAYWNARLPELRPGPELPLARLPASMTKPRFVRRSGRIERARWEQIKVRGRQAGLTPSMVLCRAFAEVLTTWSKTSQFTLTVTLFHRLPLHADVNAVIGDFTSTVLLAIDGSGGSSFVERTRRLQDQLWADLEHRYVSGVRVLRDLARHEASGPRVTVPVVFTSTLGQEVSDTAAPTAWLGDLVYGISQTPQVWLDHQVGEDDGSLVFHWDAVEALFPEGVLDAMFDAYCARVTRLAIDDSVWDVPTPSLVPEVDVRLQAAMNATEADLADATLPALVAAQVAQRPAQPAVMTPTREFSYGEVGAAADAVARWLRQHGAKPNRLVAVVMEKGWEQVVAVVGVVQAGAAYLPIEADVPAERLALLLAHGEATLVLTQSWLLDTLTWPSGLTRLAVDQWETIGEADDDTHDRLAPQLDDLAYVIFTSGSTGVPKGVMLSHRAVVNTLVDINRRWAVGPADRVLALSALSFDLSVYDIFGTLAAGGAIVLPSAAARRDPAHWLALLARAHVTMWNTVPALMQLLVETAEAMQTALPDPLRLVLLSGDWIPVRLPDRIRACVPGAQVISLGGATEAAIWSIAYPIGEVDPAWPSIPYGRPLANQTWHVLHEDGTPCPVWVPGELYIGGLGLAKGYWKDPGRTAERFVRHAQTGERLYRTGDWGRYRPDGELEFLGRDDLQVKVQGYRIELGEIESALAGHAAVAQVVVAAHGTRFGDKKLAAYVVPRGMVQPDASELRAWLQTTLPSYMVPATFHFLNSLPLTTNGKVDRKALESTARTPPAERRAVVPTRVGEKVERLIAGVLKIDRVDRDADLFSLGLTSIDMMRLANDLEQSFGFRPRMADLFTLTSVAGVTSYYERLLDKRRMDGGGSSPPTLLDLEQRDAFKREQRRLRPIPEASHPVRLPRSVPAADDRRCSYERRSHRRFSNDPVALADLAALLGSLAQELEDGRPKHRYGSAGGLYPVQTYLHVRPGRVGDLAAGTYYYHPVEHGLLPLTVEIDLDRAMHAAVNRPIFDQTSFSMFLIAQMSAITPVYAERARDFALIEAGLIAQLLEESAARHRIGLCQIGLIDFEAVRALFLLEESHLFLHALLGGREASGVDSWEEGTV